MKRITINGTLRKSLLTGGVTMLLVVLLAAVGYAAGGGGHADSGKQLKDFMWRCIDFAALVGILVWAIKKADMKKSLSDRRDGIEKALREAEEVRVAAEKKFAEYNQKLAAANKEIDELQAAIRKEAALEKERIVAEAQATADKIKEQARITAEQEVLKARAELQAEASRLAVQLAEQGLKASLRQDDQNRLVGEYLTKVVELH